MPALTLAFWRKWHRWIGFPAALFLLWAASTGVIVAFTEFFGEDEALREATRDMISPVTLASPASAWSAPIARAITTAGMNETTMETATMIQSRDVRRKARGWLLGGRAGRCCSPSGVADSR